MSKSAGTLVTTHNATYIHPRFMPGYRGHVPTMKFDYCETYGNHTQKYFQDFRSKAMEQSKTNYCKGGYFPSFYTHNPDMAVGARTRKWDRWLREPRYRLTNVDHDRKEELKTFDKLGLAHREHYKDKSGEIHPVGHFVIPKTAEKQIKENVPFMVLATRYDDSINISNMNHIARRSAPEMPRPRELGSQRDRTMRDVYFETRG